MNCREICDFLDDYLDGSLDREIIDRFERHVSKCSPCNEYLVSYKETVELTHCLCEEQGKAPKPVPPELVRAIMKSLGCEGRDSSQP